MAFRRIRAFAGLLVAVAIAALLQAILIARSPTVTADGVIFIGIAGELSKQPVETFRRYDQHPGYPALVLAGTRIVQSLGFRDEPQSWMAGGQAVAFACGLLCVWLVWLLTRELFDARVADLAAIVFAVLPVPRINAADAMSDTPHLLFYLLAAWLAVSAIRVSTTLTARRLGATYSFNPEPTALKSASVVPTDLIQRLAAAGVASGIAYWIRPEGLEVVAVTLFILVVQSYRAHWSWQRLAGAMAVFLGAAIIVAAPYPILAGKITSKQLPYGKPRAPVTFVAQMAEVAGSTEQADESAPPMVRVKPERRYTVTLFLRVAGKAAAALINAICQGLRIAFVPLYLLGIAALILRLPHRSVDWLVLLSTVVHIAALFLVYVLSGYIARRHALPIVALAMPYTAFGIVFAAELFFRFAKAPIVVAQWGVLAGCSLLVLPPSLRAYNREFLPVIEAAQWVAAHAQPGAGVICNSPYVGIYAALPVAGLCPQATTLDAAVSAAEVDASFEYVVLHVNAHDYRSEWIGQIERNYREVRTISDLNSGRPEIKVVIYQAKPGQALRMAGRETGERLETRDERKQMSTADERLPSATR